MPGGRGLEVCTLLLQLFHLSEAKGQDRLVGRVQLTGRELVRLVGGARQRARWMDIEAAEGYAGTHSGWVARRLTLLLLSCLVSVLPLLALLSLSSLPLFYSLVLHQLILSRSHLSPLTSLLSTPPLSVAACS